MNPPDYRLYQNEIVAGGKARGKCQKPPDKATEGFSSRF